MRNAQQLGFSLDEIRDLVSLKRTRHPDCSQVEEMLEQEIITFFKKIQSHQHRKR
jgi:DNA-binding transcriptional MerR regulator